MVSFIVVNYNTKDLLKNLLYSIKKFFRYEEIIVVDNASEDHSVEMISHDFPSVKIIENKENVGFARANNQAMQIAQGDVFVLINSDAEFIDDSLKYTIAFIQQDNKCGLAGCKLLNSDGSVQISVGKFPGILYSFLSNSGVGLLLPSSIRGRVLAGRYFNYNQASEVDWVMGACMILRKKVYLEVGGLNTEYFLFGEDMEWCYRIKNSGYSIMYNPDSKIIHHFNKSNPIDAQKRYTLMYKNYYSFCNKYLGKPRSTIIRMFNIYGVILKYVAYKSGLLTANDPFLSYWISHLKQALKAHVNLKG